MNVKDIIDQLAAAAREHDGDPHEAIGSWINTAAFEVHAAILDEIGEVDLSEPSPDLTRGWLAVREQLAYNALHRAVCERLRETEPEPVHLLKTRGDETACGADPDSDAGASADINSVTCPDCEAAHDAAHEDDPDA